MIERLASKIQLAPTGCWLWTATTAQGYGQIKIGSRTDGTRRNVAAHRLVYELCFGPVPDGHEIHHVCKTKSCVNPYHLITLTPAAHRTIEPRRTRLERCARGHDFDEENTGIDGRGDRYCRTCRSITRATWKRENRERVNEYQRRRYRGAA